MTQSWQPSKLGDWLSRRFYPFSVLVFNGLKYLTLNLYLLQILLWVRVKRFWLYNLNYPGKLSWSSTLHYVWQYWRGLGFTHLPWYKRKHVTMPMALSMRNLQPGTKPPAIHRRQSAHVVTRQTIVFRTDSASVKVLIIFSRSRVVQMQNGVLLALALVTVCNHSLWYSNRC